MQVLAILIRSLVRTFFEANVGFFLVVLYFAFGLMRGTEHIALATSISTSFSLTLLAIALWTFYWLKASAFVINTANKPSYKFIRQLSLETKKKQFGLLFCVFFLIGTPIWSYAFFIGVFNIAYQTYGLLAMMIGYLLLANTLIALIIIKSLEGPMRELKLSFWHKYISQRFTLPYNLWFIRHLFTKEPMLLFLSKFGSLIILLGSIYLFKTDEYDWRLIAIGSLFGLVINSMLVYDFYEFITKNNWVYNLPLKSKQIIGSTLTTTLFLFVPEIIIMLIKLPIELSVFEIFSLLFIQVSLAYFILSSLFQKAMVKEDYGKRIFYILISMIFIIMYNIPLVIIDIVLLLASVYVFSRFYQIILKTK